MDIVKSGVPLMIFPVIHSPISHPDCPYAPQSGSVSALCRLLSAVNFRKGYVVRGQNDIVREIHDLHFTGLHAVCTADLVKLDI